MHRPAWLRALALILGLWFPLVAGESGLLDPCPMHGVLMAGRSHMGGMGAMGGMDMPPMAQQGGQHQPANPNHQQHHCTCIGCCSAGIAVLMAPEAATVPVAAVAVRSGRAAPTAAARPRPAPAFSRPYTTGPPRQA